MLKKFGMVAVGVTAGLLTVAPMASATEGHHDEGHDGGITCSAEGGDLDASADGSLAGIAAPVGSGNTGQLLSCNSFLNDNLNGNQVSIL